ncbi:MAG: VOC family protein [Thermoanaerobaculia bacterium]|nr:VOC family protein [Thermoanaerobaculia bacterium]
MPSAFNPSGYNSVSPYLVVSDADATIDFLRKAFDAVEIRRFAGPDGTVAHAEVRVDDSVLMLADGSPGWPAIPAHVHVYVADVDESYRRAIAAGGVSVQEPVKKEDADRRSGVKDAGGSTWWIATRVE